MKDTILKLINDNPKSYTKLVKKDPLMNKWVTESSLVDGDHWPSKIYSAIYKESNICKNGNIKKFERFSSGFIGCGPSNTCGCTKELISKSVSKTKKSFSADKNITINNKRSTTMLEKYGVTYNSQRESVKSILSTPKIPVVIHEKLTDINWLNNEYNVKQRSLSEISDEIGVYYGTVGEYCRKAGFTIRPHVVRSVEESQISNYISSLGFTVENSNRTIISPKEIDIYVESKKIGIEVNGLYWHSYNPTASIKENRNQHVSKTNLASANGIQLIHITDHEWKSKQDIVKSLIRSKLSLNKTVFARNCQLKIVDKPIEKEFLEKYHIQGYIRSESAIGLYLKDQLLMMITISPSRFNKTYDYEILRMCTKSDITVVGGVSKLVSYLKSTYKNDTFISYCDLSKGTGIGYKKAGFKLIRQNAPGYFWTDGTRIFSRYKCQKQQLKKWLNSYDPTLSESKNLFNAGYRRYWDCGNLVFTLT